MNIKKKSPNPTMFRISKFFGNLMFPVVDKINRRWYMALYLLFLSYLGVKISGKPIYIATTVGFDSSDYGGIILNDGCVLSTDVKLLTHDYSISRVAKAKGVEFKDEFRIIKGIQIGANSFVGTRSIIMPGVSIGENSIVGAGSVVTKDVPANTIVAGNPARILSSIDDYWEKINNNNVQVYT